MVSFEALAAWRPFLLVLLALGGCSFGRGTSRTAPSIAAVDEKAVEELDPDERADLLRATIDRDHRTEVGDFDVHVCEWKSMPFHFMWVFITDKHAQIARIEVFDPNGGPLGMIDPERYRIVAKHDDYEKRVLITRTPVPEGASDGWYTARITLRDGRQLEARDRVRLRSVPPVESGLNPPHEAEDVPVPRELSWDPVPGAQFYRVFISDSWSGELILESPPIPQPKIVLPPDLLEPGGTYTWRIHARDGGGDPSYGVFNEGSLSPTFRFSTAEAPPASPR